MLPPIELVSFDQPGAAAATGLSVDVIRRAVRAGDLPVHHPMVAGKVIAKPLILASDLRAWIASGPPDRDGTREPTVSDPLSMTPLSAKRQETIRQRREDVRFVDPLARSERSKHRPR